MNTRIRYSAPDWALTIAFLAINVLIAICVVLGAADIVQYVQAHA